MKKILTTLIFLLLGIAVVNAKVTNKVNVKVADDSNGRGYVSATENSTMSDRNYNRITSASATKTTESGSFIISWPADAIYIYARPSDATKYYFIGWSTDNNVANASISQARGYEALISRSHQGDNVTYEATFYAHFGEIRTWDIVLKTVVEGGSYTAAHSLNGEPKSYTITTTTAEKEILGITQAADVKFTLDATPESDYRFLRWRFEYEDGTTGYSNNKKPEITFSQSADIYCEFISKEYAQFILKGASNAYLKLSDAIAAAVASTTSKVIVVKESGILYNEQGETSTNTYYDASSNTYTIPDNITLLVPANETHDLQLGDLTENDYIGLDAVSYVGGYRKLTIRDGQDIVVNGDICVYAKVHANGSAMGTPYQYGWIELGENSHITINSGARLNTLGYITGTPTSSSVIIKSGGVVRELLQIADWRGGQASLSAIGNSGRVFPFSQYYVQNIETKLIIETGATHKVSTAALVGMSILGDQICPLNTVLIAPEGNYDSGLFRLGDNVQLFKYYDVQKDRIIWEFEAKDKTKPAYANLDNVQLKLDLSILGNQDLNSSDYVMPLNNNFDITIGSKVNFTLQDDIALLAGATLNIQKEATFVTTNNASVFVYDNEQHKVKATKNSEGTTGPVVMAGNDYYYFGWSNEAIKRLCYRPGGLQVTRSTTPSDAQIVLDGTFQGAVYTTQGKASITSTGGGVVNFDNQLKKDKTTYQLLQSATTGSISTTQYLQAEPIPLNPSASLLNKDGSHSAGGDIATENSRTYTYYQNAPNPGSAERGRWLYAVPEGSVEADDISGHEWNFTIPETQTGTLQFTPKATNLTINSLTTVSFEGCTLFSKTANGAFTDGVVSIPIQCVPTKISGASTSETLTFTFNCTNTTSGNTTSIDVPITLTATENYTPFFKVNGKENETLRFAATVFDSSAPQTITIEPAPGNVTDQAYKDEDWYVAWEPTSLAATSPFRIEPGDYFSGVKVYYEPQSMSGSDDTQTITIKATYGTAPNDVSCQRTITLTGTPSRAQNPLAFIPDQNIKPGDEITKLFDKMGNGKDVEFTYNDKSESDIVFVEKYNENYKLTIRDGVHITTEQVITIKASQPENNQYTTGSSTIVITITPIVQWNWSDLYFDNTYTNPITIFDVDNTTPWTLTYNADCSTISSYNETTHEVVVGNGNECTATFRFTRGGYTTDFTAAVYRDPRILDICMRDLHAARTYKGITTDASQVEFNDGILFATTEESGATWTMELIGVPDKLEFIPLGNKEWSIYESEDGIEWKNTRPSATITLAPEQTFIHALKPSTRQIRIICSLGDEDGKITDLCVTALTDVTANVDVVYMPIVKDNNGNVIPSQKEVELRYVSPDSPLQLSILTADGNPIADVTLSGTNLTDGTLPTTDLVTFYRTETITITSVYPNEGTLYLRVVDEDSNEKLHLPIRLYNYPQSLPLRSEEWSGEDAEKYYFYTNLDNSQYVQFNAETQELTFSPSGLSQRFITFDFKGGPSYFMFETQSEITLEEWYDYWSLSITDGSYNRVIANRTDTLVPEITSVVRDEVNYYQVRVAIPYTTKSLTLESKRTNSTIVTKNIVIDGDPDLDVVPGNHTIEHKANVNFTTAAPTLEVVVTAINLSQLKMECDNPRFTVTCGGKNITNTPTSFTNADFPLALGTADNYEVGDIAFNVTWDKVNAVEEGIITFKTSTDVVLATIRLLGAKDVILQDNADETGFYTGFASTIGENHPFNGVAEKYEYERRLVDLTNAFDQQGLALFDYLIVYGETTTNDKSSTVHAPNTTRGSNAKTPMYIYRKAENPENHKYDRYQFVFDVENVNVGTKANMSAAKDANGDSAVPHAKVGNVKNVDENMQYIGIAKDEQLRVYMTGFCPYATVGFDKEQEGAWIFRGKQNSKLDLYLEDCHIYSRDKTEDGHAYNGKFDAGANIFQEFYARGSGGVLVFECNQDGEYLDEQAFQVTVHTRGKNLLKSNYGCFYQVYGMRAYQVSSPIQVRLTTDKYELNSKTHLTFDDKWPTDATDYTKFVRTNGFISLQKQANNAPSIDLGNANTIVNFRGGQVELQNAQNVSDKYKTTLAISYRSGIMAAGGLNVQMARGIGTDEAQGGIVNFYDGTISVIPMQVSSTERKYYLMDVLPNGSESTWTSCLRCPQNTYVYGGSICMLRACMDPTSKGGAPTDGPGGKYLGRFVYTKEHGYEYNTNDKSKPTTQDNPAQWLVNPINFPTATVLFGGLQQYYANEAVNAPYTYGIESVTPNENEELILWIPDGYGGVKAEEDKKLVHWEACMTEIQAVIGSAGVLEIGGTIGGNVTIENVEQVANLLYCDLDENVYEVISANNGDDENPIYTYEAPIKVPEGFTMDGVDLELGDYIYRSPKYVGNRVYEVTNPDNYVITDKIYYITSASSDVWKTFTAPFDVERIWVVETFAETELSRLQPTDEEKEQGITQRSKILTMQAKNNADFAAFFGVAMALGSQQSFEEIFADYIEWAQLEDTKRGLYDGTGSYDLRGIYPLTPYDGSNWDKAHFYLNRNVGIWTLKEKETSEEDDTFNVQWVVPTARENEDGILLDKGETYSMLFPYCTGCWKDEWDEGEYPRDNWDYWSGKFLVFESTQAPIDKPHKLRGGNFIASAKPEGEWIFENADNLTATEAELTGNSTFAFLPADRRNGLYIYDDYASDERYIPYEPSDPIEMITPTSTFLITDVASLTQNKVISRITRGGKIIYGDKDENSNDNPEDDTITGGHVPTINGNNELYITAIDGGINIAVVAPQYVRVLTATGAIIFNGYITTAADVNLPTQGIYVISGENESQKIFY